MCSVGHKAPFSANSMLPLHSAANVSICQVIVINDIKRYETSISSQFRDRNREVIREYEYSVNTERPRIRFGVTLPLVRVSAATHLLSNAKLAPPTRRFRRRRLPVRCRLPRTIRCMPGTGSRRRCPRANPGGPSGSSSRGRPESLFESGYRMSSACR